MIDLLATLKLYLLHVGFARLHAHWQSEKVFSPFSRLYLVTGGEGWLFHDKQKLVLKPGFLYLVPGYSYSHYHCGESLEQYYLSFADEIEGGLPIYEKQPFVYQKQASALDQELFARLLALNPGRSMPSPDAKACDPRAGLLRFQLPVPAQTAGAYLESQGIMRQLFSRFFEPEKEGAPQQRVPHQLTSVLHYIHQHLHEKLSVEKLATAHCLHPDYFSRLFLEAMGLRPLDYINNKRIEKAQLLLSTSTASLSEVAEMVGIPNIYYFSRLFRQKLNIPPGRYRKTKWQV